MESAGADKGVEGDNKGEGLAGEGELEGDALAELADAEALALSFSFVLLSLSLSFVSLPSGLPFALPTALVCVTKPEIALESESILSREEADALGSERSSASARQRKLQTHT